MPTATAQPTTSPRRRALASSAPPPARARTTTTSTKRAPLAGPHHRRLHHLPLYHHPRRRRRPRRLLLHRRLPRARSPWAQATAGTPAAIIRGALLGAASIRCRSADRPRRRPPIVRASPMLRPTRYPLTAHSTGAKRPAPAAACCTSGQLSPLRAREKRDTELIDLIRRCHPHLRRPRRLPRRRHRAHHHRARRRPHHLQPRGHHRHHPRQPAQPSAR